MSESEYQVSQKEAAEYLDVSTKTISRYRKKGLPYRMILNPVTGKQEVRFKREDLERWHHGRELLSTYGQDGESSSKRDESRVTAAKVGAGGQRQVEQNSYLDELLEVYKEQVQLLREQLEDMRAQLARRDRQIEDLMRFMVGFQLEYKPVVSENGKEQEQTKESDRELAAEIPKKVFRREELSQSVLRLRQKGKSYGEIARGLNQIKAATLSGKNEWTEAEVQSLLPPLVEDEQGVIEL